MEMPKWNPLYSTRKKLCSGDYYTRYNALRSSSCNFTKRRDVREYIFNRDKWRCVNCGATDRLTIDHIVSVASMAMDIEHILETNNEENLQTLCIRCNSGKEC